MTVTYDAFVDRMKKSNEFVWLIAEHLSANKATVEIPPLVIRPRDGEPAHYKDRGDLVITTRKTVNVKGRNFVFTDKEFPYDDIIVGPVERVDEDIHALDRYVFVSADGLYAGVLPTSSRDQWIKREVFDGVYKRKTMTYVSPLSLVTFFKVKAKNDISI